ncbi:MAG: hypothetical protein J6L62_08210 [Clostridia bacterium]|nr:hypothetical protein [Clostridia bacterium]
MKKFTAKTALSVLSFSLFALCLADTYYVHKSDVDASIIRLIETLKKQPAVDSAAENAQTIPEGDSANG